MRNEVVEQIDAQWHDGAVFVGFGQFVESLLRATEELCHVWVFVFHVWGEIGLTSELNGVVKVVQVGFVVFEDESTQRLEQPRFLDVDDVVVDAQFGANGFVVDNGQFDDDGQRVQHKQMTSVDLGVVVRQHFVCVFVFLCLN